MSKTLLLFPTAILIAAAWLTFGSIPKPAGEGPAISNTASSNDDLRTGTSGGTKAIQSEDDTMVKVYVFNRDGELVGPVEMKKVVKTEREWRLLLTPEQFRVARASGTERPFCGTLLDNKKEGVYTCVCCRLPLFSSDSKFQSGTGWPSFFQPIAKENVTEKVDNSLGMQRVEINCARCDCHLGHVFPDGPRVTGLRYCVNSESLEFTESGDLKSLADDGAPQPEAKTIK